MPNVGDPKPPNARASSLSNAIKASHDTLRIKPYYLMLSLDNKKKIRGLGIIDDDGYRYARVLLLHERRVDSQILCKLLFSTLEKIIPKAQLIVVPFWKDILGR